MELTLNDTLQLNAVSDMDDTEDLDFNVDEINTNIHIGKHK